MKHKIINIKWVVVLLLSTITSQMGFAQYNKLKKVQDLSGTWKFSIGDNSEWANKDYNDTEWDNIRVPEMWEKQGFYGYDGYAWYRKVMKLNIEKTSKPLYLSLGYIDDVDEVYINGKFIGRTGSFPNAYATAFNAKRIYRLPADLLDFEGENTISVRVYDEGGEGGIIHGQIGILMDIEAVPVDYNLQGEWYFKIRDYEVQKDATLDFSSWRTIMVPGMWENQGYKDYDGIAVYAIEFELNKKFANERMVLVLGKIDDLDQVYLNGELVGESGSFKRSTIHKHSDMHNEKRGYYLPVNLLNSNGKNTLIVKVMDTGGIGGIYEGSVGLITQDNYIKYWRMRRDLHY